MPRRKKTVKSDGIKSKWTDEDVEMTAVRLAPELLDCLMDCHMLLLRHYDVGEWPACMKRALSLIGQAQGLKP